MADNATPPLPSMAATPPRAAGGTPPGESPGQPLPPTPGAGQLATPTAPPSPLLFGGFKGGRKRLDGLKPGSPEALSADREKERLKKQRQRERARAEVSAAQPAPVIPAATATAAPLGALPTGAVAPEAGALPGLPGSGIAPLVSWSAKDVEPVIRECVGLAEELCRKQVVGKCRKARLPAEIIREIEKDTTWAERAKKMIADGAAEISALQLNKAEVPVEARPWMNLGIGITQISLGHMKVLKRLDELISAQTSQPAAAEKLKVES